MYCIISNLFKMKATFVSYNYFFPVRKEEIANIIIRIFMNKVRSIINQEIEQEQWRFVKHTGTLCAILMFSKLSERVIEM